MRTTLYTSKFQEVSFDDETLLLYANFFPATAEYTDESYKEDFLQFKEKIINLNIKRIKYSFADMRNFFFTVTPALQEWHNKHIFEFAVATGTEKLGILLMEDIFAAVSIEQTIEEEVRPFETRFFKDEQSALNWLLS